MVLIELVIGLYSGCHGKLPKIYSNSKTSITFYLASYTAAAAVIAQKKIENRRLLKGPSTGG